MQGSPVPAKQLTTVGLSTAQGGKWYWEITQLSTRRPAAGVVNIVGTGNSFAVLVWTLGKMLMNGDYDFLILQLLGAGTALQRSHDSTTTRLWSFGNALEQGGTAQFAMDLDTYLNMVWW